MTLKVSHAPIASLLPAAALAPPAWARDWEGEAASIFSAEVKGARSLDADRFKRRVIDAYSRLRELIEHSPHRHVVRMWNHLPGIHDSLDHECDRYMVFNAARYQVLFAWLGGEDAIARLAPAASGVGHDGDDFVVHALAVGEAGVAVDNPLQVPAYKYSRRYGPLPPCFARATRIATPQAALLIAGTAAIAGEESKYPGDLDAQFGLTLHNLRALIARGSGNSISEHAALDRMDHIRIYCTAAVNARELQRRARAAFASRNLEFVRADLCRADLLVEIEGIVRLET